MKNTIPDYVKMTNEPLNSPAVMMPVTMMPTAVVPAPVMAVSVVAPPHLLRLEVIDFRLRDNRRRRAFPLRKHQALFC
jgi:hypothetical protein